MVRVKPQQRDPKFIKAKVQKQVDVRSYQIRTEDGGRIFQRNRKHLHKTPEHYSSAVLPETATKPQGQTVTTATGPQEQTTNTAVNPQVPPQATAVPSDTQQ